MKKEVIGAAVIGALIGVGVGLMIAPKSGKETRKDIVNKAKKIGKKAKELDFDDVKDFVVDKVDNVKKSVKKSKKA